MKILNRLIRHQNCLIHSRGSFYHTGVCYRVTFYFPISLTSIYSISCKYSPILMPGYKDILITTLFKAVSDCFSDCWLNYLKWIISLKWRQRSTSEFIVHWRRALALRFFRENWGFLSGWRESGIVATNTSRFQCKRFRCLLVSWKGNRIWIVCALYSAF